MIWLLACSQADLPPNDPGARLEWLLRPDHAATLPTGRRELLDVLRDDPDIVHRETALRLLTDDADLRKRQVRAAQPEMLAAVLQSWVRFDEDPAWAWDCYQHVRTACVLLWGCSDEGGHTCPEGAPPVCEVYDPVRQGCFRNQGPCVQYLDSVPDQGVGSPAMWNDAPMSHPLTPADPAILDRINRHEIHNPPGREPSWPTAP
jgi:hypothetical protein